MVSLRSSDDTLLYHPTLLVWRVVLASFCLVIGLGVMVGCGPQERLCQSDDDCLYGEVCDKQACVPKPAFKCKRDADCSAPTPRCDVASGTCQARCGSNQDCGSGMVCQQGSCERDPSIECVSITDCKARQVCDNGVCKDDTRIQCQNDSDCVREAYKFCDTKGSCAWECKVDGDCGSFQACKEHRCQDTGECQGDADCALPKGRCDLTNRTCVGCLSNRDCPADKVCQNLVCAEKPGCKANGDCRVPTPVCQVSSGTCRECVSDADCPTGEACRNYTCLAAAGCSPACAGGTFCFQGERCLKQWTSCQSAQDCASGESCTQIGGRAVCVAPCDTTKNKSTTDLTNAACFGGVGFCLPHDQTNPTRGVCIPPYRKTRKWKESCLNLGYPEKADFHDCQGSDMRCVADGARSVCWKTCDPKQNTTPGSVSPNPACENGKGRCLPSANGGVCEPLRPTTQTEGKGCLRSDPNKPEWNECAQDLICDNQVCVKATQTDGQVCNATDKRCQAGLSCTKLDERAASALSLCARACVPGAGSCPSGKSCEVTNPRTPTQGACLTTRQSTRQKGETCEGRDPRDPSWHRCAQQAPCVNGACGAPRPMNRMAGQSCELNNPNDAGFGTCHTGLTCHNQVCRKACDPTMSGICGPTEKCVNLDAKQPTKGLCLPYQGLACDLSTNPCPGGFTCFRFDFVYRCVNSCNPQVGNIGCPAEHDCRRVDANDPTKGHCIRRRMPRRPLGSQCHLSRPEDPGYHGCIAPAVCFQSTCIKAPPATGQEGDVCNASKGCASPLVCSPNDIGVHVCARACDPMTNSTCSSGEVCLSKQPNKFYWTGACFSKRNQTQPAGAACRRGNPSSADYNDCAGAYVCAGKAGDTFCREACDPKKTPSTCPSAFVCTALPNGQGACIRPRRPIRKTNETCGSGDEKAPGYDDCAPGLVCATYDSVSGLKLCAATCHTQQASCVGGGRCHQVDALNPTSGACHPPRNQTRKLGESCEGVDPRQPQWGTCVVGARCHQGTCVACVADADCASGSVCKANQCVLKGACLRDSECQAPKPRCHIAAKQCVACLIDGDCGTGQICQANACKTAPGCSSDAGCQAPTPKCLVATRKCVACLADGDCPTGQICQSNTCKPAPPACRPACTSGSYCFNNEKCLTTWKTCTSNANCAQTETCVRIGTRAVCAPNCDPAKNTSGSNPTNTACFGGYGFCVALAPTGTKGICVPPRKPLRGLNQTCLDVDQPETPAYHDCQTGLECWNGVCLRARTNTQPVGSQCNRNGSGANHNNCVSGAQCVRGIDGGWCRKTCTPGASGGCSTGYDCVALQGGGGVCLKRPRNTRKVDETCLGSDVSKPSYDNCATGLRCVVFDGTTGYQLCARTCTTTNPLCPTNFACVATSSGSTQGVCLRERKRLRLAGETCAGRDPLQADWHDCIRGYGCVNNKCVTRTQSQGQACSSTSLCKDGLTCVVFDASQSIQYCMAVCDPRQSACPRDTACVATSSTDPSRGACIPTRKKLRKRGESCAASDVGKPSYNDCQTGLVCMGTQTHGFHCLDQCNPTSPNCQTGYRCLQVSAGVGACAQTCAGVSSCTYGTTCTDPGSALGFAICL
jgi:Cys-rich repeat protein